ncbi:hypothetical protein GCM10008986_07160 [Salinibacillus aidingensis]|uniref:Uncharacterized protein n=1 Tax=Salinibacillus aidingensis TaxID=237684 RepID=A0ABN1AV27_9BACI
MALDVLKLVPLKFREEGTTIVPKSRQPYNVWVKKFALLYGKGIREDVLNVRKRLL